MAGFLFLTVVLTVLLHYDNFIMRQAHVVTSALELYCTAQNLMFVLLPMSSVTGQIFIEP